MAQLTLIITAAVLFYVALTDLQRFQIRNELILVLIGLWLIHTWLSGQWGRLPWHIAFATFLLAFMLYFYARNWMGGGDVKLTTVAFLWAGVDCALPLAILVLVFATIHVFAAKREWVEVRRTASGSLRIPFAPSVAAALISVFMLGCLR